MKLFIASLLLLSTSLGFAAPNPVVEMKTNQGVITIELDAEKAPKSVANFLQYVKSGFYKDTIFHRVIDGFMIQGGGFNAKMEQKTAKAPIQNEAKNGLKNDKGTIAMARTGDPHSASSQFFINLVDNGMLNNPGQDGWGYAVFGKVTEGLDIVEKIGKVKTSNAGGHGDVPTTPVVIESVKLKEAKAPKK